MKIARIKQPDDRLDYDVDFSRWLVAGDSIASVAVNVTTDGTVVVDGYDHTATAVKFWLSGGVSGESAHVEVTITTVQVRVKEVCVQIRVRGC